jgi:hypothetical protein
MFALDMLLRMRKLVPAVALIDTVSVLMCHAAAAASLMSIMCTLKVSCLLMTLSGAAAALPWSLYWRLTLLVLTQASETAQPIAAVHYCCCSGIASIRHLQQQQQQQQQQ